MLQRKSPSGCTYTPHLLACSLRGPAAPASSACPARWGWDLPNKKTRKIAHPMQARSGTSTGTAAPPDRTGYEIILEKRTYLGRTFCSVVAVPRDGVTGGRYGRTAETCFSFCTQKMHMAYTRQIAVVARPGRVSRVVATAACTRSFASNCSSHSQT